MNYLLDAVIIAGIVFSICNVMNSIFWILLLN